VLFLLNHFHAHITASTISYPCHLWLKCIIQAFNNHPSSHRLKISVSRY
jgi:hypothetical protein